MLRIPSQSVQIPIAFSILTIKITAAGVEKQAEMVTPIFYRFSVLFPEAVFDNRE
jgi:hypothetical protein